MYLQVLIIVATTFQTFSAKRIDNNQVETVNCKIPYEKKNQPCEEFAQEDLECTITEDLKSFNVEKLDQGCVPKIQSVLSETWNCTLKEEEAGAEYDAGEIDYDVDLTCIKSDQLQENLAFTNQTKFGPSTIVWIVVPCIVAIGLLSFFILKKKLRNS